ncbi:tyrosine-type recombinase/integrase [Acidovorax sp. Leaf73]|uniref:tyrosine-type recombinase/integrase n=1 Tax=Acidovorax sp. Leaf73 TaxID=2876566 RepID=UPI001E4A2524|nr:tyrosine-type recombinase/integrase [Acidovorax sp. Leaf73]
MRIELIRPSQSFRDAEEVVALAGLPEDLALLYSIDLPVLPVLLDDSGLPLDLPNQFISSLALLKSSATGKTASTYAECLLAWLRFIESKDSSLEEATEEMLSTFRNALVSTQGQGGTKAYTANTVNLRVTAVEAFHAWLHRKKLLMTPLGEFVCTRNSLRLPYCGERSQTKRSSDSLRIAPTESTPRTLGFEELARLFAITPEPFKLMFRWGLVTGLRRFEVANLRLSRLMTPAQIASSGLDPVPIDVVRKGGRTATIYAPAALVEETHWYCLVDRPVPINDQYADYVFLSQRGAPFSVETLSRAFRKYANLVGSRATLHHLRHSFAIYCLGYLESVESAGKQINPVKVVQFLLGHANVTTTEIYLRALEVSSDEVREALSFLYGATQ